MPDNRFKIRDYHPTDSPSLYRICLLTGLDGRDATGTVDPEVIGHYFVAPYAVLEPELVSILTCDGAPVGYIVGTTDTLAFEKKCEKEWWPALRERYMPPEQGDNTRTASLIRAINNRPKNADPVVKDYPAHLHINLLPEAQGKGLGKQMIETFVGKLKKHKVKGIHLVVGNRNQRAINFYKHLGFKVLAERNFGEILGIKF